MRYKLRCLACTLAMVWAHYLVSVFAADYATPRLLYFVADGGRLIASNIAFNRADEEQLGAQEQILRQVVTNAVAVIVTNQRIISYSALRPAWRSLRMRAGENLESVEAEDFAALVVTSDRVLSFNGKNAVWAQKRR